MTNRPASLVLVAALLAAACGKSSSDSASLPTEPVDTFGGSATATSVDVNMPGTVYVPNHIDIAKGGQIRFIFTAVAHDVRFNGAAGAPSDILATSSTTVTRTFSTAGTFAFLCTLHANMTGTVTVH